MNQVDRVVGLPSNGKLSHYHPLLNPKSSDVFQAKQLMNGKLSLRSEFGDTSDQSIWLENSGTDRLWRLELHSLRWVDCLRRITPTGVERSKWFEMVSNWIDASENVHLAPEAWRINTAIQRCQIISLGLKKWWPNRPPEKLLQSLREHFDFFLAKSKTLPLPIIDQLVVACILGSEHVSQGEALTRRVVRNILESIIDEKGLATSENVSVALEDAKNWKIWITQLGFYVENPEYWLRRLGQARELAIHATDGSGQISGSGHNEHSTWSTLIPESRAESYVATCGSIGDPPEQLDFVARSGWGFSRSGWGETERELADETIVGVRFGKMVSKTGFDDNSSLTFYSGGKQWLSHIPTGLDPSLLNHNQRHFHSSITIHSHDYRPRGQAELVRFRKEMRTREYVVTDTAYKSVQMRRTVVYSEPGDYVTVVDQIRSPDEHGGYQNWIFPPDVEISLKGSEVLVSHKEKSFYLKFLNVDNDSISVEDITDETLISNLIGRKLSIHFSGHSTRLVTVFGSISGEKIPKIHRLGVSGNNVCILHQNANRREQLVISKEGAAVGAPNEFTNDIIHRIERSVVFGTLTAENETKLRTDSRKIIESIKVDVRNKMETISARKIAIDRLIEFAEINQISGMRDFGLGATLIDMAGHDLQNMIENHPLVTQKRRMPVLNWNNNPELRHAYYNVPVRSVVGPPEHLDFDLKKYLISMDFGQLVLPAYVNLECPGDTLSVMFHGATDRARNTLPRFERMRSMESLGTGPIAFFSDPCLDLDSNMILSWYVGTEDLNLHAAIASMVQTLANEQASKRIVLIGNSGGAFAALQVASYLDNACVVAFNPQIEINKYAPRIAATAQENIFGMSSVSSIPSLSTRMNVIERYQEIDFARKVYFIQNTGDDHHFVEHFLPFKEAFESSKHPENLCSYTPDLGPGHRVPGPDSYLREIRNANKFFYELTSN